jgi:hypothetical protein
MGSSSSVWTKLAELEKKLAMMARETYYPGEIKLWPFPPDELPEHWYLPNGDLTSIDSVPGKALVALSPAYKSRWGITIQNGMVSLPDVFDDSGDGLFFRAVNGTARTVGSKQGDAIRDISGTSYMLGNVSKTAEASGPFSYTVQTASHVYTGGSNGSYNASYTNFRAGDCVPTANENRPNNVGLTPGIYLPPLG